MVRFEEKAFKSILNKLKYADNWFWARYTLNPYNGCQFGCIYCDARSSKYHLPLDFENHIIIKQGVDELLYQRLSRARKLLPDVVGISGTTDPYQPAEAKFHNTRKCLVVLAKRRYPVHIFTKSRAVMEDLDLLEDIGRQSWATVSITIISANERIARFLDVRAPSPSGRFNTLKKIKSDAKHIQSGVLFIPMIPYLTDSKENLEEMVKRTIDAGGDYLLFGGGMTLRDTQALWFLQHLKAKFPSLLPQYESLYGFKYNPNEYQGRYYPSPAYLVPLHDLLFELCDKHDLPYRIKRFIPTDFRKYNYLVAEEMLNRAYKLQMLDKYWSNLFWAGMNIQNLEESILDTANRNELTTIKNVGDKTATYIRDLLKKLQAEGTKSQ